VNKNTFTPVFAFGFSILATWYSIYSFRNNILDQLSTVADVPDDNWLSNPSIQEQIMLLVALAVLIYGLYKIILFLTTGKVIDEEEKIDTFVEEKIMVHDRKFSRSTNILIWFAILAAFGLFLTHLIPIAMDI
jgi:hypothetical protein